MASKATCAAPSCEALSPCRGLKATSRTKGSRRNLGDLVWPAVAAAIPGRGRKARSRSCRGTGEESDGLVVPMKRPNKPVTNGGGGGGGKGPGRREGRWQRMPRTQCRTRHVTGVACLRTGTAWAAKPRTPVTFDLRQEPGAGKPHAGICAGGVASNHRLYRDGRKESIGTPTFVMSGRRNGDARQRKRISGLRGRRPWHVRTLLDRKPGNLLPLWPRVRSAVRIGKSNKPKPMMRRQEKSKLPAMSHP